MSGEVNRRAEMARREGVATMSEEEMRRNLVTCDFRGCEVKGMVLEELLRRERDKAWRAGWAEREVWFGMGGGERRDAVLTRRGC